MEHEWTLGAILELTFFMMKRPFFSVSLEEDNAEEGAIIGFDKSKNGIHIIYHSDYPISILPECDASFIFVVLFRLFGAMLRAVFSKALLARLSVSETVSESEPPSKLCREIVGKLSSSISFFIFYFLGSSDTIMRCRSL